MGFLKRLLGRGRLWRPPEPTQTESQRRPTETWDYGRELSVKPGTGSVIPGKRLVCDLDEITCLTCLELDGSESPPRLPIHGGCRCITEPLTKTYRQLGLDMDEISSETRSSAIGQVSAEGGLYKAYLIERARALDSGKLVSNCKSLQ